MRLYDHSLFLPVRTHLYCNSRCLPPFLFPVTDTATQYFGWQPIHVHTTHMSKQTISIFLFEFSHIVFCLLKPSSKLTSSLPNLCSLETPITRLNQASVLTTAFLILIRTRTMERRTNHIPLSSSVWNMKVPPSNW